MTTEPTLLVTGGAGYIGSHVVLALLAAGRRVVVLDDLSTGDERLLAPGIEAFHHVDVGDVAAVRHILEDHDIGTVLHFAGAIINMASIVDPIGYYARNTGATLGLLQAMEATGRRRIVFSSTAAVYGDAALQPVPETAPVEPLAPYGASKAMVERILTDAQKAGKLEAVCLRYFNVAGADEAGRSGQLGGPPTHLIRLALEVAVGRREILEIFGTDFPTPDGTTIRDYIHVSDLADAHLAAVDYLEAGRCAGEKPSFFNCGYGEGLSVLDVIEEVRRVSGHPMPTRKAPARDGDAPRLICDSRRAREILGWQPRIGGQGSRAALEVMIRSALAWQSRMAPVEQ
ncbi:MAG: UDP-glucose 4-epimerase GalE [Magnetovibrionaceae bacterium]